MAATRRLPFLKIGIMTRTGWYRQSGFLR
jgi:hypothetical protein